jgi:hypothetical protein
MSFAMDTAMVRVYWILGSGKRRLWPCQSDQRGVACRTWLLQHKISLCACVVQLICLLAIARPMLSGGRFKQGSVACLQHYSLRS